MIPDFPHNIRISLAWLKFFCCVLTLLSLCPVGCLSFEKLNCLWLSFYEGVHSNKQIWKYMSINMNNMNCPKVLPKYVTFCVEFWSLSERCARLPCLLEFGKKSWLIHCPPEIHNLWQYGLSSFPGRDTKLDQKYSGNYCTYFVNCIQKLWVILDWK